MSNLRPSAAPNTIRVGFVGAVRMHQVIGATIAADATGARVTLLR